MSSACALTVAYEYEKRGKKFIPFTYKTFIPVYSFSWHLYKHTDSEFLIPSNLLYAKHTLEIFSKICVPMMLGGSRNIA